MERKPIKSSITISTILFLILGAIGFNLLAYYMISNALKPEYPQIVGLVLGGLFGFFGVGSIVALLTLDIIELDDEKIRVLSIFKYPKKTIYYREILSYNEIEKENKSGRWFDLTIFTKTGKYKISSMVISNYREIRARLINGVRRNEQSERLWYSNTQRNFGIGFIIIGLLFLIGFWNLYDNKDNVISTNDLTTIKVTIADNLKIQTGRRSRSSSINISTIEHPGFNFKITGSSFDASDVNGIIDNIKRGDKIELTIITSEYEKKLIKTKPLSFWDKVYNYSSFHVFGIKAGKRTYLTPEAYSEEHEKGNPFWAFAFLFLISLGFVCAGIYLLIKRE